VISSAIPLQQLPQLRKFLNPVEVGRDVKVRSKQTRADQRAWSLCDSAELYLNESVLKHQYTIIAERETPLLLLKHVGMKTAVCLRSFETALGTGFVKGNWYEPFDYNTVQMFRGATGNEENQIQIQPLGLGFYSVLLVNLILAKRREG
jgi:hypothetical protein